MADQKIVISTPEPEPAVRAVIDELQRDCAAGDPGVNLDAHNEPDWLRAFATAAWDYTAEVAPLLFPTQAAHLGMRVTRALAAYARGKAHAIVQRTKGDIQAAEFWERDCSRVYRELPGWARTW